MSPETCRHNYFEYLFHVVAPLLVGSFIYIAFRSESLLVFQWLNFLELEELTHSIRQQFSTKDLSGWALYSLPDGLWTWAATGWLWIIWRKNNLWTFSPIIIALCSECGQFFQIVPGEFDWLDCLSYVIGCLIPRFVMRSSAYCEEYKKSKNIT